MVDRLVTSAVLIALLGAAAAAQEELSNEACLACHGGQDAPALEGKPLYIDGGRYADSVHGPLPCTTCHADATAIPHAEPLARVGLDTCEGCHDDVVVAYRAGIHGEANGRGIREAATCNDCHGNVHTVQAHTNPQSRAHWSHLVATCAQCHSKIDLAKKFDIPVVQPVDAYLDSVHGRAVAGGKRAAVCSDCHGVHDILPHSDPRSPIARGNVPATCGRCHGEILNAYRASVHGAALRHAHTDAPVCTDCHGEHRILGSSDPSSPVFAANIPTETCGRCHGNARLSEKYGLSLDKVSAFRDSFHGLALRAGRPTVANCASCHGVHDILPSSDPRSTINPANLPATCGKCHPGAGSFFAIGSVHGSPKSQAVWLVWWVRFLYVWLIAVTIGSMTVHNGLDIARKARSPHPPPPILPVEPERMSRGLRWQHGLVMLSFPILVYTGFALTYPESWWAAPLLRWEERLALRGTLHRAAAVVLLAALAWHLAHVLVSRRLRTCMRGMLPSWGDVSAFVGALGYYVGLRAHAPHGGTFSYAEKAEYWAFMWGCLVMSITGLLLWFENTTLHYLPTWIPDVATAIHFWEAVLATLSIVVWHLYWVIFDPEVYPMDWTWWNGRPPTARVLERQAPSQPDPPAAAP
jgi:cytochrome b subunit of formate dehydrogenase